jgi:hypothetical protein
VNRIGKDRNSSRHSPRPIIVTTLGGVSGGSTCLRGFQSRLEQELKSHVSENVSTRAGEQCRLVVKQVRLHLCKMRHLPLGCHCNSGVNRHRYQWLPLQFRTPVAVDCTAGGGLAFALLSPADKSGPSCTLCLAYAYNTAEEACQLGCVYGLWVSHRGAIVTLISETEIPGMDRCRDDVRSGRVSTTSTQPTRRQTVDETLPVRYAMHIQCAFLQGGVSMYSKHSL